MIPNPFICPKTELGLPYEMALFDQFNRIDPRLRAVLIESGRWFFDEFDKRLIYTCVNRTRDENKQVGGSDNSAHLFGRAVDIRVHNLTGDEVNQLLGYINLHWNRENNWLYVIVHGNGNNRHLHINIRYEFSHGSFA